MSNPNPYGEQPTVPLAPPSGAPTPPSAPPAYGAATPPAYGAAPYGGPQPGYPQPPSYPQAPGYPYGYAATARTNTLAVVSLIASLSAFVLLPVIGSIVGIITGHLSLGQLKTSGEGGRGVALAGTIIGWVSIGLVVLALLLIFGVFIPLAVTSRMRYGV